MNRLIYLLALALAACASGPLPLPPPDADVRPVVARDVLDGQWAIAAVNGRPLSGLSLTLSGKSARYQLACNSGFAAVSRNGDKLFLANTVLTEMGCEPARIQLDSDAIDILRFPMTMELTPPDRLRLINEAGTLDLVRQRS
jgi:heat shock protein HslJ